VWEEEQPDNPVFGPLTSAVEEFVRTLEGAGRSGETPPSDSLVTATLIARTRELADVWSRLDADAYLTHFSDDFTFYFEGSRVSRARFEAVVRESIGSLRESTFEILNPEVEALGASGATISFELREVMIDASGATSELNGVMTLVYERRGGRWLIVRAHESLLQQRER
jgi:ketosteroid isomerase-like protein